MGIVIGVAVVLLIEFYGFTAIRGIAPASASSRKIVIGSYIAITFLLWVSFITYRTWGYQALSKEVKSIMATLFLSFTVAKLITALFLFPEDISRGVRWLLSKFQTNKDGVSAPISRSEFLNKLALAVAAVPFGAFIYGAVNNAYNYRFRKIPLAFPHLPEAFDGFTIVQLSDIHSGSFARNKPIEDAIEKINALNADLILFTGDLVNNVADEMADYKHIFSRLRAKYGVMSVTGNHDYGDYIPWNSIEEKKTNFQRLINTHKEMGWDILMNDHRVLEKNGEKIAILGIENWGARMRFPKYGKMPLAYEGTKEIPFKILMSHDPSHWDAQVRPEYPDIDLTLSGHTHGFQFGIENKVLKWSPVQWAYKQWAGLYQEGAQYLYVNRGFGFIGYPGRIGILPEVAIIELKKS
jgi:predicted MPP superfamily phosphohydrolase